MKLLFLRKRPAETAFIALLFAVAAVGIPYVPLGRLFTADPEEAQAMGMSLCRLIAAGCFLIAICEMGLGGALERRAKCGSVLLCAVPAFVIAVNNLPILALANGSAGVNAPWQDVLLLAVQCLCVALFEEAAFRGTVFPLLLQHWGTMKKGRFTAVIVSSLLFALLHLLNFAEGGAAVIAQVGYSFLIGGMLAALFFSGASVFLCATVHALYNFCGYLIPQCGYGDFWALWNAPTIAVTVLLSVAVAAFLLLRLWRDDGASAAHLVRFPHPCPRGSASE